MNKAKRPAVIAGNWKMNKTPGEALALAGSIAGGLKGLNFDDAGVRVLLCVPFVSLQNACLAAKGTDIKVAAQNMHYEQSGAFTGEISARMLADIGVFHAIIGHSERRQYFGETDETVNKKIRAAVDNGITPIVCVGESLEQRDQGRTAQVLTAQVKAAFHGISAESAKRIIVAYEPVWAIGTGRTASPEQADEGNGIIRSVLSSMLGADAAEGISILYGGSMNAENAPGLLAQPNVDGGLIGGASLDAQSFVSIVRAALA